MKAELEPAFVSLEEAATFLGISRSSAYRLAERDELPVQTRRAGRRWIVSIAALREFADKASEPVTPPPSRRLRAVR